MPKVSVLMPVYNTEEDYLREAIESILKQTFTDFEFIIINDGSTNDAEDTILSYNDNRIKYVKNEHNLGIIRTLNKGLELAQGEYIARMDADDISLSERFEKQIDFLDKNTDIDVLGTWFNCIPRNRVVETYINDKEIKECLLINSNNLGHPTIMFRTSTIKNLEIKYDENNPYVEDYALWLSLIAKVKFANLPEILLNYRIHSNSVCQTKEIEQSLNVEEIMVKAQGKYFGIDNKAVLEAIGKLKKNLKIDSKELLAINDFPKQIQIKMKEFGFVCDYDMNKVFYKYAIKKCKKDFLFYKLLWTSDLNKLLRLHIYFKIYNSIYFEHSDSEIQPKYKPTEPKISVVMALYNTPYKMLRKTVKSVLNQTFTDFELIIMDDSSTIKYKEFFEKFNDERIKYFKLEKNSGPGKARNIGIKKALGKYIAIADSDDIYKPKRFETQLNFLQNNPEVSLVSCAFKFSNKRKISPVIENDEDIKIALLFNSALSNPAVMFNRKEFLDKNLFYQEDINFAEDYSLWIDAMFSDIKMANLKDVLMIYTRRKNQLSKTKTKHQDLILKNLYTKIFLKIGLNPSEEELDLHHKIYEENFSDVKEERILLWFEKIINANKEKNVFKEEKLINLKNQTLEKNKKIKNRLFKMKIGNYNLCLSKKLIISSEKRP